MRILTGEEEQEALRWLEKAAEVASRSLCKRARCGSILIKNDELISEGFNSPPLNKLELRRCLDEYEIPSGFRHDRTCCIHAEQRAIQNALKNGKDPQNAKIYFMAVESDGKKVMATDMKCTICSRAVLDVGISEFIFYSAEGVRAYPPEEVDQLSYQYKTPLVK